MNFGKVMNCSKHNRRTKLLTPVNFSGGKRSFLWPMACKIMDSNNALIAPSVIGKFIENSSMINDTDAQINIGTATR